MTRHLKNWLPYAAIMLVYLTGFNLDIMEVDAAQYASISLEMLKSGIYLEVFDRHEPYLDKPPLLFWLSALSFKLFGVGSWQYRLPSVLFSLLGIFSTYRLGKTLYSESVGRHASWILGGSLAMVMINNDVKTDTILVSAIIFSIWMLVEFLRSNEWSYLIGAAFGVGAAMLTKGPIGIMTPMLAVGGHILLKRRWQLLLNVKWLVLIIVVGVLLLPMCVGLYNQHGMEGLKFFFWTQSFGRITGESSWQNDTTVLFFTHIFLWSFLPWTFLAIAALISEFKNFRKSVHDQGSELFLISGVSLVWIALSLSRFKLPHYIFVVYPLVAILSAKYIHQLISHGGWARFQLVSGGLICLSLAILLPYCFPAGGWWLSAALILFVVFGTAFFLSANGVDKVMVPTFMFSIAIGLALNLHFYPQLLPYQANSQVGKWVQENNVHEDNFVGFATGGRALDFYSGRIIPWMPDAESTKAVIVPGMIVYANEARYADLKKYKAIPKQAIVFKDFEVQNLSIQFLNPNTREKAVKKKYVLFY